MWVCRYILKNLYYYENDKLIYEQTDNDRDGDMDMDEVTFYQYRYEFIVNE